MNKRLILFDLFLVLLALAYYLFFVNKGIILSDEGYYVHYAERIANGQLAYKDFLLQYTPGYFYLLAFLYKLFGTQILVGRFLNLFFCLCVLISVQVLLHVLTITSRKIHLLTSLVIISLGYPLLHIPLVIWPCVFIAVLLVILSIQWYKQKKIYLLPVLGLLLALALFFRQTIGLGLFAVINIVIILSEKKNLSSQFKSLLFLDGTWLFFTGLWLYLFFVLPDNLSGLQSLITYNRQFATTYRFTYPPLSFLLQPTGFFKLLPYYYPIIYGVFVLTAVIKRRFIWQTLVLASVALTGFFITVYPASDLLHVYPFLSLVIVSSILFFYKRRGFTAVVFLSIVFIFLGLYLTFFTKSFRYEGYFLRETSPLNLPKTTGMSVDMTDATRSNLLPLTDFINTHTKKNDYLFVYPFAPMLYFLLDRQNPSGIVQFVLLEAPETVYPETRVLDEIRYRNVRYIIAVGPYKNRSKISAFIQKQHEVFRKEPYIVFEIVK